MCVCVYIYIYYICKKYIYVYLFTDVILCEEDLKEIKTYRSISGLCVRVNLTKYQKGVYCLAVNSVEYASLY